MGGNKMSSASTAKKIASKMAKSGSDDAIKILEKYSTVEAATALKGAERQKYLDALDEVYGGRAKRAKDLGFEPDKYYHGTNKEFAEFDPAKTTHSYGAFLTPEKKVARWFANKNLDAQGGEPIIHELQLRGKPVNPYLDLLKADKLNSHSDGWDMANTWKTIEHGEGVPEFLKKKGMKNVVMTEQMGPKIDYMSAGPHAKTSKTIAVSDPKDIRSTNAAFDPRFKDSANILALAGNQAPKIAAKMLKPHLSLGTAFQQITEPIEAMDRPANELIDKAGQKFGQLTDLTRGKDKDHQERAAGAFKTAVGFVAPTPSNLMFSGASKVLPIMKAVKPSAVAESMRAQKSAAELYRDAKAAIKSQGWGSVVVKPDAATPIGSVKIVD
ncbi:MAG: hypothetical protein ACAH17_03710 [Candidatus Paceibacterota bacterium]